MAAKKVVTVSGDAGKTLEVKLEQYHDMVCVKVDGGGPDRNLILIGTRGIYRCRCVNPEHGLPLDSNGRVILNKTGDCK